MKFWWSNLYYIQEIISDKNSYFLEKLNETMMKNFVYNNKLKKFWLQDSQFDISENNKASENDDQDSDIDISKTKNNNQNWISNKKFFMMII